MIRIYKYYVRICSDPADTLYSKGANVFLAYELLLKWPVLKNSKYIYLYRLYI